MNAQFVTQTWDMLKRSIEEIQNRNNSGLSFEELYRNAYTLVLNKHGDKLYGGLRAVIMDHLTDTVLEKIVTAVDDVFLKTMNECWKGHVVCMVMIRDILMYLDRVYVPPNNLEPVYTLGVNTFRDVIVCDNGMNIRLKQHMLKLISNERKREQIDWFALRDACAMMCELGIYENDFEITMLEETRNHYKRESQKFLAENSAAAYIKQVESCILDETDRARRYLQKNTENKLLSVVEEQLISAHLKTVVEMRGSGVVFLLENDRVEDLRRVYQLFVRVPLGAQAILDCVSLWLRGQGETITRRNEDGNERIDPLEYIQSLLDLKERCDKLLCNAFRNDKMFKNKMHTDFEYFINNFPQSAEFLVIYMDSKLRKGIKVLNDVEIDACLDRAMSLFRFLSDKDVFEHFYKRQLSKRLLTERSVSDDCERAMVSKLKVECGYQYTSKLEQMFKDKELWSTMQDAYKEFKDANPVTSEACEINVVVLTSGFWPTPKTDFICILPIEAQLAWQHFELFYNKQHNGRKLTINTSLGCADVKATFYNPVLKHEVPKGAIVVSNKHVIPTKKTLALATTHQMAVLMMFNHQNKYTTKELAQATKIQSKDLEKTLQSLALGKQTQRILSRKGASSAIDDEDEFTVNDNFTHKMMRVRVSALVDTRSTGITDNEQINIREKIAEDRKHEIECAIVRIMKDRKMLDHNNLVSEVIRQMSHRFTASPPVIKQRIEGLIERDYLSRDLKNQKMYTYVA